jgi:hypothetical protein
VSITLALGSFGSAGVLNIIVAVLLAPPLLALRPRAAWT